MGLIDLILWLDPRHLVRVDTVAYLNFIMLLIGVGILVWNFYRSRKWLDQFQQRLQDPDQALDWPMPLGHRRDQQLIEQTYNAVIKAHHSTLETLIDRQTDQQAFIDSWVHEIKVPLAAAGLLSESLEGQAPEEKVDQLSLQLDRINFYIDQVLYYSRLDSFSHDYLLQDYSLKQTLADVIVANRNSFIDQNIQYSFEGTDQKVLTDQKWLSFILTQIISNSLKYTPTGGKITAVVSDDDGEVQLTIKDTGIGIPLDEQHRVFEKGFTGTNGRNANQKATGLGLFLAQQLSEKLGHSLTLASTPGQGTAVTLHFPYLSYYENTGTTLTHQVKRH
ncbi:Signal transduction histidine kinase [Lacticaseibacillus brantae DSM 23927]|uniref:histidine kinase n=1 Tax=Lacticaseibacillus brantae DSM 23927 TaxID=1423727 RepID=A0A0R2AYN9_9LACO|nr:Signal transduction histidine kinase [Lacticaseibacillus brantae DSM 23927]